MVNPTSTETSNAGGGDPTRTEMKAYYTNLSLAYHVHALPEHGLVYIKNPKAACSTVLVWLSRLQSGQDDFSPKNVHTEHLLLRPADLGWPCISRMLGGTARGLQTLALGGRLEAGRAWADQGLAMEPGFRCRLFSELIAPQVADRLAGGARLLGLPA